MPLKPDILKEMILQAFPDAEVEIIDTVGDNNHYEVKIISSKFKGIGMIAQHRLVYDALNSHLKSGELHAISLKTKAKE
ncbi:BolA/IbaG family iron-sulfur metabolism protein [Candidatus Jidaibacter acanthamoebae]|nr:BolA/IbaG family iron-sulfur metabolism protein [Candidatus Jidaibacter acanthamoeba]